MAHPIFQLLGFFHTYGVQCFAFLCLRGSEEKMDGRGINSKLDDDEYAMTLNLAMESKVEIF